MHTYVESHELAVALQEYWRETYEVDVQLVALTCNPPVYKLTTRAHHAWWRETCDAFSNGYRRCRRDDRGAKARAEEGGDATPGRGPGDGGGRGGELRDLPDEAAGQGRGPAERGEVRGGPRSTACLVDASVPPNELRTFVFGLDDVEFNKMMARNENEARYMVARYLDERTWLRELER